MQWSCSRSSPTITVSIRLFLGSTRIRFLLGLMFELGLRSGSLLDPDPDPSANPNPLSANLDANLELNPKLNVNLDLNTNCDPSLDLNLN